MNALELADALDNDWADKFRFDAATMLRQQQAEIEASIKLIKLLYFENQEFRAENKNLQTEITESKKLKTITKADLMSIAGDYCWDMETLDEIGFAKALGIKVIE